MATDTRQRIKRNGILSALASLLRNEYEDGTPRGLKTSGTARQGVVADRDTPADDTAAVINYPAAGPGVAHVVSGVAWSYNGVPLGGRLTIEDGAGTIVFDLGITSAGPGFVPFPEPKKGSAASAMIITLAAGGAGVAGKVNALNHWTE